LSTFSQLPGDLGLTFVSGDELNVAVNLQRNVQNYQFSSYIYRSDLVSTGGGDGSFSTIGATVVQPTIGIVDASAGSMVIGLSETQTAQLIPGNSYRWFLRWVAPGEITRTIVSGDVTAVAP
jgi:hypothetical protein